MDENNIVTSLGDIVVEDDGADCLDVFKIRDHPLIGRWRIVEADLWGRDYLDLVDSASITIRVDGYGEIAFGAMQASLDLEYSQSTLYFFNTLLVMHWSS